jgi:hypothetical protein
VDGEGRKKVFATEPKAPPCRSLWTAADEILLFCLSALKDLL